MNFESYRMFPTLLGASKNELKKSIVPHARKILKKFGKNDSFLCPCSTTIRSHNQVLQEKQFEQILSIVLETIKTYCDIWKYDDRRLTISESWLNLYKEGDYQDLHHHHNSAFSGVIYLQSDGEKDFIIQSPWFQKQPIILDVTEITYDNLHHYKLPSSVGVCYIFPSFLLHRTLPAKSERISLSFNFNYTYFNYTCAK